jgi:hypothetical protein
MTFQLPFVTEPDPLVTGEGAIDPLGLANIGDKLAEQILPGLRARMSRVRFVTAMAVAASVCDGLEDEIAADGVTSSAIAFEWFLADAFARAESRDLVRRTPGIDKARAARQNGLRLCARTYLKTPSVFGFNGVYKSLARHIGVVDEEMRLGETGHALLDIWEHEQGVSGFVARAAGGSSRPELKSTLRAAVEDALTDGYASRSSGWQGWAFFLEHLVPSRIGCQEAAFIRRLLEDPKGGTRGEVLALVDATAFDSDDVPEHVVAKEILRYSSEALKDGLVAIQAYEDYCRQIETGFGWLIWLSSARGAQSTGPDNLAAIPDVQKATARLGKELAAAERALAIVPAALLNDFEELTAYFREVKTPQDLYHCLLRRHGDIQKQKPPNGKREWFEYAADGNVMVRIPYRAAEPPEPSSAWPRPYRLNTVRQFAFDLGRSANA